MSHFTAHALRFQRVLLPALLFLLSLPVAAQDFDGPLLESVTLTESAPGGIVVTLSEELLPASTTSLGNYTLTPTVGILTAQLVSTNKVRLTTGALNASVVYTVTVKNLQDLAGNTMAEQSLSLIRAQGAITLKTFGGIFGTSVDSLLSDPSFPDNPSETSHPTESESVSSTAIVGYQMMGYVHAPSSGDF